jgi:hypothetical protein
MQGTIDIPDTLATRLQAKWQDAPPHYVFEQIIMEGYRDALLTTLPDNVLQAFNSLGDKQPFARFFAHSRRNILDDEDLPILLKDVGDGLFLKGFLPHFIAH